MGQRSVNVDVLPPSGPFAIGTKVYCWVDPSRHEKASKDPSALRQLIVQVWYPAESGRGPSSPFVPQLNSYRGIWEKSQVEVASHTQTHSHPNAKPIAAHGGLPIVLFSHGWEGTRSEYTSFAEDLASHGYAVFGVDHPYMGRIALPNGEVTESTESQFHSPAEVVAYYAGDLEFVIREIADLNSADPEKIFVGKFDVTRIAAIGHSSGFVAASGACKIDSRIRACINIDAPGFGASDLLGLDQPLLWIRLEKAGDLPAEYLKMIKVAAYELQIEAANHGSVEDWDYLEAASPTQREAAGRVLRTIRRYVEAFLAKHLNRQNSDLPDALSKSGMLWRVHFPVNRSSPAAKHP